MGGSKNHYDMFWGKAGACNHRSGRQIVAISYDFQYWIYAAFRTTPLLKYPQIPDQFGVEHVTLLPCGCILSHEWLHKYAHETVRYTVLPQQETRLKFSTARKCSEITTHKNDTTVLLFGVAKQQNN